MKIMVMKSRLVCNLPGCLTHDLISLENLSEKEFPSKGNKDGSK